MPNREMRGRYLLREFWSDVEIQTGLTADERWFLVGLWMLADDGGWLDWDPVYVGQQLYQYQDRADREQNATDYLQKIVALGKAKTYRCGHVYLPAAETYKRPGRTSDAGYEVRDAHHSETSRKRSGMKANHSGGITPPDLTLPHLNKNLTTTRGRARGGAPRSLKEIVGWNPDD